jgi:hypothetical protein
MSLPTKSLYSNLIELNFSPYIFVITFCFNSTCSLKFGDREFTESGRNPLNSTRITGFRLDSCRIPGFRPDSVDSGRNQWRNEKYCFHHSPLVLLIAYRQDWL